jgi:hypothetical protein
MARNVAIIAASAAAGNVTGRLAEELDVVVR